MRFIFAALLLSCCVSTTEDFLNEYYLSKDAGIHFTSYQSRNMIIIEYSAVEPTPSLTTQAIDMANQHCNRYRRTAEHVEGKVLKQYGFNEIHTFKCEPVSRTVISNKYNNLEEK